MRVEGSRLLLSATDLAGHLGCRHLTSLNRLRAEKKLTPPYWHDPLAEILRERGEAHERAYLQHLQDRHGIEVTRLDGAKPDASGVAQTQEAMASGVGAIAQAPLVDGRWRGLADVLLRVEIKSDLGAWSYVVADTKLALETKGGTVLQLCLYTDVLNKLQGILPEHMLVVAPGRYDDPERLRTRDFFAYYRRVRAQLERVVDDTKPRTSVESNTEPDTELSLATYPDPVPQCDTCRWWKQCDTRWRKDDHLSLVAGISRMQRRELVDRGLETLSALATAQLPLDPTPKRGSKESYERVHHQARIQLESRDLETPLVEFLNPKETGTDTTTPLGLSRLPSPSPGDIFLDFEGDAFVEGGGLEYLFGWVTQDSQDDPSDQAATDQAPTDPSIHYQPIWALSREEEKTGFQALMDFLTARFNEYPDFHIYHFAPYEPSALKRLMGRHATREDALDRLLRAGRFIDLHAVVREGLRIGIESYGLKQLEDVHHFPRELPLREASYYKNRLERALELGDALSIAPEEREAVQLYNQDDCISTLRLRDWLEGLRAERIAEGISHPRPPKANEDGEPSEELDEHQQRIEALKAELVQNVPEDPAERTPEEQARWLLAHLLEWHRREDKASWWEFFRLADLAPEDLRNERRGLAGLAFVAEVPGGTKACPIHRYKFPEQDQDLREGQPLLTGTDKEDKIGTVHAIDLAARTIDVKKRKAAKDLHPWAFYAHENITAKPLPEAIERLANWVLANGIDEPGPSRYRAARDLLLKRPPRLADGSSGAPLQNPGEETRDAACRLALSLRQGVLPIQGPPGTGKTHTGARMITELVRQGKKVGVTAVSHSVIRNLLDNVLEAAQEEGLELHCVQKPKAPSEQPLPGGLREVKNNPDLFQALEDGSAQVAGATVWAWARDDAIETLDYLVIDEAGQMSLTNALAAAQAAHNVVLLGDPQQLEQPMQGSHPEGCDASALEQLLGERDTIAEDRGLFLGETWRLHPRICEFTSELFYEGRLESREGCGGQAIVGRGSGGPLGVTVPIEGAGLWLSLVEHEGNTTSSPEEVERVVELVRGLLGGGEAGAGAKWVDREGVSRPLGLRDVLVVAPYNAQVAALQAGLPEGARVGTVDKFQGQEAPVVIYSLAASSGEEAPRGVEFLLNLNRLNVATSRARCGVVVVASVGLLEVEGRSPRVMRLVNGLCRYSEIAGEVNGIRSL